MPVHNARLARKQIVQVGGILSAGALMCLIPWAVTAQRNGDLERTSRRNVSSRAAGARSMTQTAVVADLLPQKLALVPDNIPVHLDSATLVRIGRLWLPPEEATVDTRPQIEGKRQDNGMFNNEWTLVKTGKHLTVRAWATADQALKAGNGDSALVFSAPPSWLPPKNLVAVEVAFYRFQFDINGVAADGKKADIANSAAQVATIASPDAGVQALVEAALNDKDLLQYVQIGNSQFSAYHFEVAVRRRIVHLTGQVDTPTRKEKATRLAQQILARFDIPFTVSNELKVGKLEQ